MKLATILCSLLFFAFHLSFGQEKKVFVLEIRDEIDPRMSRYVKLALESATEKKADYILVDMNTYGGAVDDADKIRTALLNYPKPVFVYINDNAASAGALISIACDSIYMTQGASIGAATVVNGNDGQAMPDKYQSYMRSKMRATAEANNRNPQLAEAMVDQTIKLDSTIKKDGKVLTLTTTEAIKYGFCEAQVSSKDEVLKRSNIKNYTIEKYELTLSEKVIAFVLNPFISGILILAIIGGIYYEMQAPGIGFALLVAIVAGVLYLVPYYLNGLAANWEILLLIAGILLLMLEIFVIPGFGVAGILGIVLVCMSLVLIMLNNTFFDFTLVDGDKALAALSVTFLAFLVFILSFFAFGHKIFLSKRFSKITLNETLTTSTENVLTPKIMEVLIGKHGISHTTLRPSGKVEIENQVFDALTTGDYIEKGESVVVTEVFGQSLKVKKV